MLNMDHRAFVMDTLRTTDTGSPDLGRRKRPLSIIEEHTDEDGVVVAHPSLGVAVETGGGEEGGQTADSPVLSRRYSAQRQPKSPPATQTTTKKTRKKAVVFDHHPFFTSPGQSNGTEIVTGNDALNLAGNDTAAILLTLRGRQQLPGTGFDSPREAEAMSLGHDVNTSGNSRCDYSSHTASRRRRSNGEEGGGGGGGAGVSGIISEGTATDAMTSRQRQTDCSQCCGQSRHAADLHEQCRLGTTSPDNESTGCSCVVNPSPLWPGRHSNKTGVTCSSCTTEDRDIDEKSNGSHANSSNGDNKHDSHYHNNCHKHRPQDHMRSPTLQCTESCGQSKPAVDFSSSTPVRRASQTGRLSGSGSSMLGIGSSPSARRVSLQPESKGMGLDLSRLERRFSLQTPEARRSIPDSPSPPTRRFSPQPLLPCEPGGSPLSSDSLLSPRRFSPQSFRRPDSGSPTDSDPGGTEGDLTQLKDTATKLKLKTRRPSYLTWRAKYIDKPRDPPEVKVAPGSGGDGDGDGRLTQERKARVDNALEWIKRELIDLRRQDQSLAKQLLGIRHELSSLRLAVSCEEHQDLLDEAQEQMEELRELSRFADFPPEMLGASPLRQIGVTKMNLSSRRFSTC